MKKGKTILLLLLFTIAFFALGYFRNYIFLTLNNRASSIYYNTPSPEMTGIFSPFKSYSYNNLIATKWVLTFISTLLFAGLSFLSIYIAFNNSKLAYICIALNGLVFTLSLLFITIGKVFYAFAHSGFNISRSISHLQQSPIITIVFLLAVYYNQKLKSVY